MTAKKDSPKVSPNRTAFNMKLIKYKWLTHNGQKWYKRIYDLYVDVTSCLFYTPEVISQ